MAGLPVDLREVPLIVAARSLAAEYRRTANTLQSICDGDREHYMSSVEHPVALGVPLPMSLLEPHLAFRTALLTAIEKIRLLAEGIEAWADDIQMTVVDVIEQTRLAQHRSAPY